MSIVRKTEKSKRYLFMAVEGAGLATAVLLTPWVGIPVMGYGAYLGYEWFKFRAKNGMRF